MPQPRSTSLIMPTPVGHTLAGLAIWAATERPKTIKEALRPENLRWAAFCVVVANVPDLDFFSWTGGGLTVSGLRHHGVTHSLGFALLFAAVAGLYAMLREAGHAFAMKVFILTLALYASHVFIDVFCVDTYAANGIGVPLIWPATNQYFIVPLFNSMDRAAPLASHSISALFAETVFFGAVLAAAWKYGGKLGSRT